MESRFLSMRGRAAKIGMGQSPRRILATGGASQNSAILQVLADVFGVEVGVTDVPDSAALGAAFRAYHGAACEDAGTFLPYRETIAEQRGSGDVTLVASPKADRSVYDAMLPAFLAFEDKIQAGA